MFEFDEHFDELEAMEAELTLSSDQDSIMLPFWSYVGNDVWKLDFDVDSLQIQQEWRIEAVDVA